MPAKKIVIIAGPMAQEKPHLRVSFFHNEAECLVLSMLIFSISVHSLTS